MERQSANWPPALADAAFAAKYAPLAEKLRAAVPPKRFVHSVGVAAEARRLAARFGENEEKAWLAGLLHDCAKGIPTSAQVAECDRLGVPLDPATRACPQVAHGFLGAFLATRDYGISDPDVLDAIRKHTVGAPEMSRLDKIVFLADGTEPGRHYPGVDEVRAASRLDLDDAMRAFLDGQVAYLAAKGGAVHPSTAALRDRLGPRSAASAARAPLPAPLASVLVRAHDDGAWIGKTLSAIFAQKTDFPFEVVVCDDASRDRTREIAAMFPVRFVERPDGPYMPGRTLNALVAAARGEIVAFDNADAVPAAPDWLSELVAPLRSDPARPVFAFANQLPRPDASPLVRKDSERAFGDGSVQASWRFFFSLASAATLKRLLVETPFDETIRYSEDVAWAWRASRRAANPVAVLYRPSARVEHSHDYTLRQLAKRFRGEGAADGAIFGDRPALLREIAGAARETLRDWVYLAPRPREWSAAPLAPVRRLVQRLSHWQGLRDFAGTASRAAPPAPEAPEG